MDFLVCDVSYVYCEIGIQFRTSDIINLTKVFSCHYVTGISISVYCQNGIRFRTSEIKKHRKEFLIGIT